MSQNETETVPVAGAPWQREFFKNIESFVRFGLSHDRAKSMLLEFLTLSSKTPQPRVMECFRLDDALDTVGVYTQRNPMIRDFMVEFLEPLMKNFTVEGIENIKSITPLFGRYPITLISNHISHLDAPAIYNLLYREGGDARALAERLVFIAGRLAFEPDFTRLGLYMFDTLLVCSRRDMSENPGQANLMTKINMRSFRQSQQLQKDGKVIAIFPEGTRSRTGKLMSFVDSVYHYVTNKIIIPITLSGTDEILPTSSFIFNASPGKLTIGKPLLVGKLSSDLMESLPDSIERLPFPDTGDKKQYVIDNLALYVGQNLHRHRLGAFRNLYRWEVEKRTESHTLITRPERPKHRITVVGHTRHGVAAAAILANHDAMIRVYTSDRAKADEFNEKRTDLDHFPLYHLPPNIEYTTDPASVQQATLILQAVRPWELAEYYTPIREHLANSDAPVVNLMKGFTGSPEGLILSDLATLYGVAPSRHAVLSGATSPEQVMERKMSGYEIAAADPSLIPSLTSLFTTGYSNVIPAPHPDDVAGVQIGGALKGIYALGIGLVDAYYEKHLGGSSDNPLFYLSHYMLQEMIQIGTELGAKRETFTGLSGIIDFIRSSFGNNTKDRTFAHDLFFGKEGSASSGLHGLKHLASRVRLDRYPILETIHSILVAKQDPEAVFNRLTKRLRHEETA